MPVVHKPIWVLYVKSSSLHASFIFPLGVRGGNWMLTKYHQENPWIHGEEQEKITSFCPFRESWRLCSLISQSVFFWLLTTAGSWKKAFYKLPFSSEDWQHHVEGMTSPCGRLCRGGVGQGWKRADIAGLCVGRWWPGYTALTQEGPPHIWLTVCDFFGKAELELNSKGWNHWLLTSVWHLSLWSPFARAILPEENLAWPSWLPWGNPPDSYITTCRNSTSYGKWL